MSSLEAARDVNNNVKQGEKRDSVEESRFSLSHQYNKSSKYGNINNLKFCCS